MKGAVKLLRRRRQMEHEVEDELSFHIELLTRDHLQQGLSPAAADVAARQQFGDAEQIKQQCVEISRRSHPLVRALKAFLILMFFAGALVRFSGPDPNFRHLSDLMMAVPVLGHLLLYARALTPAKFLPRSEPFQLSILGNEARLPVVLDETNRTPVQRLFSDD